MLKGVLGNFLNKSSLKFGLTIEWQMSQGAQAMYLSAECILYMGVLETRSGSRISRQIDVSSCQFLPEL